MCNIFQEIKSDKNLFRSESSKYWVKRFGSDILIQFPLNGRFWISVNILLDIQPANWTVIISARLTVPGWLCLIDRGGGQMPSRDPPCCDIA